MRWKEGLNELLRRFQVLFSPQERFDRDLEEEMRLHRDLRARELRDDGANLEDARYAAQRRFGDTLRLREEIHQAWGWTWLDRLILDLRYAARRLRQSPGFTIVAVFTLALGFGANTAIFSFMDALLMRSLPVPNPQSLVVLKWHIKNIDDNGRMSVRSVVHSMSGSTYGDPHLGRTGGIFPFPAYDLLQTSSSPFSRLFAYHPARNLNVLVKGQADIQRGEYVSGDFFPGLEVPPAAGRLISTDDDRVEAPLVTVASFGFSQRYFGSAANAVGQAILVNSVPVTVVGVTAPEFFGVDPAASTDLYFPIRANVPLEAAVPWGVRPKTYLDQHSYWIEIMARLRPGVSMAQAQAALAPLFHQWEQSTATTELERANLPALVLQEGAGGLDALRRRYSKPLYILLALVGLILAIACANIANLLLARATGRRREMALRLSIGAGKLRLVRLLLTESILLAALGGAFGVLVSIWGIRFLTLLLANGQQTTLHAELNWQVLGMAAALSIVTGILFGLAPALQSTRVDVVPALKEIQAGESRSRTRLGLSHMLVVSQIGLSLLMLVAAGLFVRTLQNLQSVELGINRENLLLFELNARQAGHREPEIISFYDALQKRFSTVPGVRTASFAHMPLIAAGESGEIITVPGKPADESTRYINVSPEFFSTMQIQIVLGREIGEHDQAGSPGVVVVNELFARLNFGNENPLGHRLNVGNDSSVRRDMEIIGVTKDAHYGNLKNDVPPVVYVPYNQSPDPASAMTYVLRTTGNPLAYVKTIRDIVHQADVRVPVTDARTQAAAIDQSMGQEIMFAKLCTAFALLALIIACVGLYGTMSYNVARRTGEIGIRMALGARRGTMVWMVLREVFLLSALGLAIGLPAAFVTSRLIRSFLFNMKPNDPLALTLAVATLLGAALVAGYAPARRASRVEPMVALRHE